jgi:hypothetical protein
MKGGPFFANIGLRVVFCADPIKKSIAQPDCDDKETGSWGAKKLSTHSRLETPSRAEATTPSASAKVSPAPVKQFPERSKILIFNLNWLWVKTLGTLGALK